MLQHLLPALLALLLPWGILRVNAGTPAPSLFFEDQIVDHEDLHDGRRWKQRYYTFDQHFRGPGSPIFVILGGEGAIEPETGLMYPFVTNHLAPFFGAFVLEPEHRFYGASQPIYPCEIRKARETGLPDPREQLLTYEQALLDAMRLISKTRDDLGCSKDRFSAEYCPTITVGGSYPGFLSAMARIMFPQVIDMAYAASAPMRFYAQQVDQTAYYKHITDVAETAVPGCAAAVRSTLLDVQAAFRRPNNSAQGTDIGACPGSIPDYCDGNAIETFLDEAFMMVGYTFANDNMAFYPPTNQTRLHKACSIFTDESSSAMEKLKDFLVQSLADGANNTCFDMSKQLPLGPNSTISGGDWSGVGTGHSGESWDFQTCTLCVEAIGFDVNASMFPDRRWSLDWLAEHCQTRFGVTPQPLSLNQRWHIDDISRTGATRILFTNGLNDGWSVSGIQHNVSASVLALNFPNGAHHSDLSGKGPTDDDTDDIKQGFVQIRSILATWLEEMPGYE